MSTPDTAAKKKREKWPRVRKIEGRKQPWLVDARVNGVGERFFFSTAVEADTKAEALRIARQNGGTASVSLPDALRVEAVKCAERLAALGATLTEATEYFIRHARPESGPKAVDALVTFFIEQKRKAGMRPEYLRVQRHVLNNFANAFPKREIHTITAADIEAWMEAQPWTLRTRENYRRDLSKLFRFAMKHGHTAADPTTKIEKVKLDDGEPCILKVQESSSLLFAAANADDGALLPYVAIGLFAGLRTSELQSLAWEEVSLDEKTIVVLSGKAKGRARRVVTMSDNLRRWLQPYAQPAGPVVPRESFRGMWRRVRTAAGLKWDKNALRHSFASYHLAAHQNGPKTSLEMGHDNPHQLFENYKALVTPANAKRYWLLSPMAARNVVRMPTAS